MRQDEFTLSNHNTQNDEVEIPTINTKIFKVPFGLKDGRMCFVKDVLSGIACGCVCPACGHPLVAKAKDSQHRRPHFAHYKDADCRTGFETAVHRMAKQLIADRLSIVLPAWDGELIMPNPPFLIDDAGMVLQGKPVDYPARNSELTSAELESRRGDYIPDVTAHDEEGLLLIEIRVSHAVDEIKRQRIQSEGVRLVEIDLSRLSMVDTIDDELFELQVLANLYNRIWLSCPPATELWRESLRDLKVALSIRNKEIANARALEASEQQSYIDQQTALAIVNKVKSDNREEYRQNLRRRFHNELAALPNIINPNSIHMRIEKFLERDTDKIASTVGSIENPTIRALVMNYHRDAWIYGVHPILWQAMVCDRFVSKMQPGSQFNQSDVANWVRDTFGIEQSIYQLFRVQYKARSDARRDGYRKNRISAWFFTDSENAAIPNIYHPINCLVEKLEVAGFLKYSLTDLGVVEII